MKKIKIFIMIFAFFFLFATLTACSEEQNNNQTPVGDVNTPNVPTKDEPTQDNPTNNVPTVDVEKVTLTDATVEYTGEAIALLVKNLPGGVSVDYSYTLNDEEVTEMVEVGVYTVTAVIKDNNTGDELKTLTATLTIKEREVRDEIPNDLEEAIELTYSTTYKPFVPNPDDATQLIAAGLELYASETIYFLLAGKTTPLNFLDFDAENSVEAASLVENTIVISEPGTYDVIMTFPEGSIVPTILVRAGKDSSEFYFRGTMNDYGTSDEYKFVVDTETNTASYEIALAVGDVFKVGNYYWSVAFDYNPHFTYMPAFSVGGEFETDVKVNEAGTYKFVVDLQTKTISTYKDGELLIQDREQLFFRGSMNNWDTSAALVKKNGVASIELALAVGDIFKIADVNWTEGTVYAYEFFQSASEQFELGTENSNVVVKQAGTYRFEITLEDKALTVYKDNVKIIDKAVSSRGNATGTINVYFSNNYKWAGDIYMYAWNSTTEAKPADWPGIKMTFVKENDYGEKIYMAQIDIDQYDMVIFTNGTEQSSDAQLIKTENTGYYVIEGGLGSYDFS